MMAPVGPGRGAPPGWDRPGGARAPKGLEAWLSRRPSLTFLLGLALIPPVEYGDYLTGLEVQFDLFYLGPVALTTWFAGRRYGLALALFCGVASGFAETLSGGPYATWNAFVHLTVFAAMVLALAALHEALERERSLARTDALTGAANRRHFMDAVAPELERSRRYGHPLSLAIMDLDNFKAVNDALGHAEGDEVLRATAETLMGALRATDTLARLGGDEFAILLPETGAEAAVGVLKKLRARLSELYAERGWPVAASFGAASYAEPPADAEAVMREVDALLYRAKDSGKDALVHDVAPGQGA